MQGQTSPSPHAGANDAGRNQMPRLESSNFFKMSGMPRFGKQWLDNFI